MRNIKKWASEGESRLSAQAALKQSEINQIMNNYRNEPNIKGAFRVFETAFFVGVEVGYRAAMRSIKGSEEKSNEN